MKKSLDRTFLNYGIRQEDLFLQMVDEESGEMSPLPFAEINSSPHLPYSVFLLNFTHEITKQDNSHGKKTLSDRHTDI